MNRRLFLRSAGITGLGLGALTAIPMEVLAGVRRWVSPNDRIGVGLVGCNGMGWVNLTSMLKMSEMQCVALCDVDDSVLESRMAELAKINLKPTIHKDYRKLLAQKDVDVVIIATPDHWHCLIMVDACAAGKQVYLEKPASNSVAEAEWMVKAANKYGSVVQVNQWQRSQQHFKAAVAYVQSGKLGGISQTKAWMYSVHGNLAPKPNAPVPAGVDYARWLGPAQRRDYNRNRFHYSFRWYWDYAGGLMTDWGVHLIDVVLWGMKAGDPKTVAGIGGHFAYPTDDRETPDTQTAVYNYDGFQMTWEHSMGRRNGLYGQDHGVSFIGELGTLVVNRSGWEVRPEMDDKKPRLEAVAWQPQTDNGVDLHTQNFVAAVKAKNPALLNCSIDVGATVAKHCHLGNVALRSGETLSVDSTGAQLKLANKTANALLTPIYHNGWQHPNV